MAMVKRFGASSKAELLEEQIQLREQELSPKPTKKSF